jgi:hypothetical protein
MPRADCVCCCIAENRATGDIPAFPAQWFDGLCRALVSAKSARMCERAVLTNRQSLDPSPFVLKGLEPVEERGTDSACLPQPEQLHGLRARTEQGREWMMAQDSRVVVGIDELGVGWLVPLSAP